LKASAFLVFFLIQVFWLNKALSNNFKNVNEFVQYLDKIDTIQDLFRYSEYRAFLEKAIPDNAASILPYMDSLIAESKEKKRYKRLATLFQISVNRTFYEPDFTKEEALNLLKGYEDYLRKNNQIALALQLKADYIRHYDMPIEERNNLFTLVINEMLRNKLYDEAVFTAINQASVYGLNDVKGTTLAHTYNSIRQAVEMCDRYPVNLRYRAKAYGTLAFLFYNKGSYDKAEKYAKMAIEIYLQLGIYDNNLFWQLNILALNRRKTGQFDSSLAVYRKAMPLFNKSNSQVWKGIYYGNMGWAHGFLGRYDSAIHYFKENIKLSKAYGEVENFTLGYIKLAEAYIRLGDFREAKNMLDSAEHYNSQHKFSSLILKNLESVKLQYYIHTNQSRNAAEAFDRFVALQDSIERQRQLENIREAELSNELVKMEKELEQVQREKELADRNIGLYNRLILMAVLFLAIMAGASLALYRLYRDLSIANAALKKNDESKNRLFSILAHDLRSPMAVIITGLRMMENRGKTAIELDNTLVEQLRRLSENFLTMLDNTLFWARSQLGGLGIKREPFAPYRKLAPELNNARDLAKAKGITLQIDIDENLMITSDISLLSIMVRNLLSNAIKFTAKGGHIMLSLKKSEESPKQWVLMVKDNGVGMSTDQLDQLFVLKNKKSSIGTEGEKGTGMGMVLVKDLIELLDGKIEIESQKGLGTTVICYFR
jgi:signal transduction histidine kinase